MWLSGTEMANHTTLQKNSKFPQQWQGGVRFITQSTREHYSHWVCLSSSSHRKIRQAHAFHTFGEQISLLSVAETCMWIYLYMTTINQNDFVIDASYAVASVCSGPEGSMCAALATSSSWTCCSTRLSVAQIYAKSKPLRDSWCPSVTSSGLFVGRWYWRHL